MISLSVPRSALLTAVLFLGFLLSNSAGYAQSGRSERITEDPLTPPTRTTLLSQVFHPAANVMRCRTLDPGAAHLGEPSERIDTGALASDASNLPTILAQLPPNVLGEIQVPLRVC